MIPLAELGHAQVPVSSIPIGELDSRVDSSSCAISPFSSSDLAGSNLLKFPVSDLGPDIGDPLIDHTALSVGGGAGKLGLHTLEKDIADGCSHGGRRLRIVSNAIKSFHVISEGSKFVSEGVLSSSFLFFDHLS